MWTCYKSKRIIKKNILIAGSLPAQNDTYEVDKREKNIIEKNFFDQARIINPYIDFCIEVDHRVGQVLKALKDLEGKGEDNQMDDNITGGKNWMDNLKGELPEKFCGTQNRILKL